MAIVTQISIYDNTEIFDKLGDLDRLKLLLDNIPDYIILNDIRKNKSNLGRIGYPLEVLINIYWTKEVLQHNNLSHTLRELNRNSQLRKLVRYTERRSPK